MSWLIALGVVILLAMLPLGGRVNYDAAGLQVWVLAGPVRVRVIPGSGRKQKKPEEKKTEEPAAPPEPKPPQKPPEEKPKEKTKGGSLTDFLPFARLALELLGSFRRRLRVNNLYVRLILAGDDPADLAVNYGRAWAALGNVLPNLERVLRIQKRDIQLGCDFAASQTRVVVRGDITIRLGQLLALAAVYGARALKEFFIFKNKRKGGANNEPKTSQHAGIDHSENS